MKKRSASDKAIMWEAAWRQVAPQIAPDLYREIIWQAEYEFASHIGRKYRLDYACRDRMMAIEIDGINGVTIDVHHLTYERLWHERLEDVQLLCRECHKQKHK